MTAHNDEIDCSHIAGADGNTHALLIYGASDDLIEIGGSYLRDEYDVTGTGRWQAQLSEPEQSGPGMSAAALVHVEYTRDGTWMVGLSQVDEDTVIPADWRISLYQHPSIAYTAVLQVTSSFPLAVTPINS